MATSTTSDQPDYRPDIDGLRGVAVLLVLFFHADLGFPGGYVGVDVFFVISGYLITGIISRSLEAGDFRLAAFWGRRIRRIIPAAAVVAAATLLLGSVLLLPRDVVSLADSGIWQQLMLSNVYFWRDVDYFAAAADTKPLLHTWSLAVEEQFYLGFPLLLVGCARLNSFRGFGVLGVLAVSSFALSEWGVRVKPTAAFFLLPTRMWELLVGAMLARSSVSLTISGLGANVASWVGLVAVVASGCLLDASTRFPGTNALIPTLGAALIIFANTGRRTQVRQLLSNRAIVLVGLISYSLYLWHWPILAFQRYWFGSELALALRLGAITTSVLLAWLSWHWVETPFRRDMKEMRPRTAMLGAAASALLIVGYCATMQNSGGCMSALPAEADRLTGGDAMEAMHCFQSDTADALDQRLPLIGHRDPAGMHPSFLLWGDSHAMALAEMFSDLATEYRLSGAVAARRATTPLLGTWKGSWGGGRAAVRWNDAVMKYVRDAEIKHVFLVARWAWNVEGSPGSLIVDSESQSPSRQEARRALQRGLRRTASALAKLGVTTWIVKQIPLQEIHPPRALAIALVFSRPIPRGVTLAEHRERQRRVEPIIGALAQKSVVVLDPEEFCFDREGFSMLGDSDGSFYADQDHVTPLGAHKLVRSLVEPAFLQITEDNAASTEHRQSASNAAN